VLCHPKEWRTEVTKPIAGLYPRCKWIWGTQKAPCWKIWRNWRCFLVYCTVVAVSTGNNWWSGVRLLSSISFGHMDDGKNFDFCWIFNSFPIYLKFFLIFLIISIFMNFDFSPIGRLDSNMSDEILFHFCTWNCLEYFLKI